MDFMNVPEDYTVIVHKPIWNWDMLGLHSSYNKEIHLWPWKLIPKWFGLRNKVFELTWKHEAGHAWGIEGCSKPWCLMFEAKMWKDKWNNVWWEQVLATIFGVFNKMRFCKKHRDYINEVYEVGTGYTLVWE